MTKTCLLFCLILISWVACNSGSSSSNPIAFNITVSGLPSSESVELGLYETDFTQQVSSTTITAASTGTGGTGNFTIGTDGKGLFSAGYFAVSVETQPATSTCTVSNSSLGYVDYGTKTVAVVCSTTTDRISGTVSGLLADTSFSLSVNNGNVTEIANNGHFEIDADFAEGATYTVNFASIPDGQLCTLDASSGTFEGDVSLSVTCTPVHMLYTDYDNKVDGSFGGREVADQYCQDFIDDNDIAYSCSGGVHALLSTSASDEIRDFPVVYDLDVDLKILRTSPTSSTFNVVDYYDQVADNWTDFLDGTIDNPLGMKAIWTGSNESGTLTNSCLGWTSKSKTNAGYLASDASDTTHWSSSNYACSSRFYIGCVCMSDGMTDNLAPGSGSMVSGTVSGLASGTLTLALNGDTETINVTDDGTFVFTTKLTADATYEVTVSAEPDLHSCSVANGAGIVADANITDVTVTCTGTANFFFPSDDAVAGNFGDREAANAVCSTTRDASYASVPCSGVVAFLSYSADDEVQDFPDLFGLDQTLPFVDVSNSNTAIADDWADLTDGTIDNGFAVNWWSGTIIYSESAGMTSGFDCTDFTSSSGAIEATVGHSGEVGAFWSGTSDGWCDETYPIMCLCYQAAP